jgi:hypothetical protein
MKRYLLLFAAALLVGGLGLGVQPANAAPVIYTGDFDASDIPNSPPISPGSLSGTWTSEVFDPTSVAPGFSGLVELQLTQLSLTPSTIGSTVFDTSNTRAYLVYNSGNFNTLALAGTPNGADILNNGPDDFAILYSAATGQTLSGAGVQIVNDGLNVVFDGNATGSFTVIPEPTTLALLGLGGLAMLRRRRVV